MTSKINADFLTSLSSMLLCLCIPLNARAEEVDPLPSWNAGATKTAIVDFVRKTTTENSPEFVPLSERISTFDNDGTLWATSIYK